MNKYLERDLKLKLLDYGEKPLTQDDLNKITEFSLNNYTLSDKPKEIDLSELSALVNINNLTLQRFYIGEEQLKMLSSFQHLGILQIVSCQIDSNNTYSIPSLRDLIISTSEIINKLGIVLPEHVTINGINTKFDLSSLEGLDKTKDLRLTNIKKIHNSSLLIKTPSLETLMLDGSKLDDKSVIDAIKDRVLISQEEHFYNIR